MGAWGYGPFENDDALDFVADLETTTGTGHLSTVLSAIADDRSEYYPGTEEAHTNPTRQRGECLRALAGASG